MPLSYNWSGMTTLVNNMSPAGNTNQGLGLQLGWMSLIGGGPFPDAPRHGPRSTSIKQIIILLTDGLNTQNRWYLTGHRQWASIDLNIDTPQKTTCDNVNAAKITLYTIQVNTGGDPTSTLLKKLRRQPGQVPGQRQVLSCSRRREAAHATTFQQIGTNLSNLRISQ